MTRRLLSVVFVALVAGVVAAATEKIGHADTRITYVGSWETPTYTTGVNAGKTYHRSRTATAEAQLSFTGDSVKWIAGRASGNGSATVYIDNILKGTVSFLGATTYNVTVWQWAGPNAAHTLRVVVSGNGWVPIDAFEVGGVRAETVTTILYESSGSRVAATTSGLAITNPTGTRYGLETIGEEVAYIDGHGAVVLDPDKMAGAFLGYTFVPSPRQCGLGDFLKFASGVPNGFQCVPGLVAVSESVPDEPTGAGARFRLAMSPNGFDQNNDGTADPIVIPATTGTTFDYGDDNTSAVVFSPLYRSWLAIKNGASPKHGYVLTANLSSSTADFDFPTQGGANVDAEGVALTDPFGGKFYISTEQLGSTEYIIEYDIADAIAGNDAMVPTKQWTIPDSWCNNANSWEGIAFVPDPRYGPTNYRVIPRGYFIGLCQGLNTYSTFILDTDEAGVATTPSEISIGQTPPCSLNLAAGCGIDYDWQTGLLWWSVGTTVAVTDQQMNCLGTMTVGSVTDAEGIGVGNGYMVIADDASGTAGIARYSKPRVRSDPYSMMTPQCGNVSVNPGSIATVSTGTATATVSGLLANDVCTCAPRTNFDDDLIVSSCYGTANTLNLRIYNPTGGAIDADAQTVDYCCFR